MYNSKLIRLYRTLDKEELKLLKKWVHSPMHNQHPKVIQLYDFMAKRKTLSSTSLKKERAFEWVFSNQKYDVYKLNHIISYAYEVLVLFIDHLEAVQDENWYKINEIRALKKRKLIKSAQKSLKRLEQQQATSKTRGGDYYLHAFVLEVERFELNGTLGRSEDNNLKALFEKLSTFYQLTMLQYACIATTHTNVYKTSYDIPMLQEVLNAAAAEQNPTIQLYYYAYQALNYVEEEVYYQALKIKFYQHHLLLPVKERRNLLLLCINYAIKRFNMGAVIFVQEAFSWYLFGLESTLLMDEDKLSHYAYKNIVGIAIRIKEFDWAIDFIKEYTPFLAVEKQENYQHFAIAKWHFAQQQYESCKLLLIQVEYDDLFLNIDSKIMLLKIYYEEKSYNALDALLHSFKVFLDRKEVMSYHKKNYKNLIVLTQKLYRYSSWDKAKIVELRTLIKKTQPLTERQWLLEKVNKLPT